MSRIFVTGDTHGELDMDKLNTRNFPVQSQLTKDDFLIITGDFGCCWYGGKDVEKTNIGYEIPPGHRTKVGKDDYMLNWYDSKNFTTLVIDGNHENHKLLNTFPVEEWHGGLIHRIRPSIIHLMRGQVYEIAGKKFFTMGGAKSTDKIYRIEDVSWWAEELPSDKEYETALDNLEKHSWKVDYVLTHCCGNNILEKLVTHHHDTDKLTGFLMSLEGKLEYKQWFFGHHHMSARIDDKHRALYDNILEIKEDGELIESFCGEDME